MKNKGKGECTNEKADENNRGITDGSNVFADQRIGGQLPGIN